jgi:hypothetical protein
MIFEPECIPCIVNQTFNNACLLTNGDTELQIKILKKVCQEIETVNTNFSAPFFSSKKQAIIEEYLGVSDPYQLIKEKNLKAAEQFIPYLQSLVANSSGKLAMAIRIAIIGNIIDLGVNSNFNIENEVKKITSNYLELPAFLNFKEDLARAERILYIADNYEEALFDKILLTELLPKKIVFATRSKAVLNDITINDAKKLGIDKICEVIESGSTIAGTDLNECTPEFLELFKNADMVISKGQGNYETLLNEERPIYFLFKVKCEVISKRCGYPIGKGLLLLSQNKSVGIK